MGIIYVGLRVCGKEREWVVCRTPGSKRGLYGSTPTGTYVTTGANGTNISLIEKKCQTSVCT